jgi:AcrR family transcriptional regulator
MLYSLFRTFVLGGQTVNPTKARILKTALNLFNEQGSGNVSTRHIADALDMSPGNLYYHYPHKEAIVQTLFSDLDKTWDKAYDISLDEPLTLARVAEMLEVTFEIVWQYRFFFREMTLLVHNDPTLTKHYRKTAERSKRDTRFVVECAVDAGLLKPLTKGELEHLTEAILVISSYWLSFKEMNSTMITKKTVKDGVKLLVGLLEPYFTASAKQTLPALVKK